jgi:hypothetical protein
MEMAENMLENKPILDPSKYGDSCPGCYKQNPSLDLSIKPVGTIKPVKINSGSFQKLGN